MTSAASCASAYRFFKCRFCSSTPFICAISDGIDAAAFAQPLVERGIAHVMRPELL